MEFVRETRDFAAVDSDSKIYHVRLQMPHDWLPYTRAQTKELEAKVKPEILQGRLQSWYLRHDLEATVCVVSVKQRGGADAFDVRLAASKRPRLMKEADLTPLKRECNMSDMVVMACALRLLCQAHAELQDALWVGTLLRAAMAAAPPPPPTPPVPQTAPVQDLIVDPYELD